MESVHNLTLTSNDVISFMKDYRLVVVSRGYCIKIDDANFIGNRRSLPILLTRIVSHQNEQAVELWKNEFFLTLRKNSKNLDFYGAPEKSRTPNLQIRSLTLYPIELRALVLSL